MGGRDSSSNNDDTHHSRRNATKTLKQKKKSQDVKMEVDDDEGEEEDGQMEAEEEKHCICDSRNYTTLMIQCDYCEIWYHIQCVGIGKKDPERIEKFACKKCTERDQKLQTIYKKGRDDKKIRDSSTKSGNTSETRGKKTQAEVKKEPPVDMKEKTVEKVKKGTAKNEDIADILKYKVKIEPNTSPVPSENKSSDFTPILLTVPLLPEQQQLQETHPELRCNKCIGCFREKDCGKCVNCVQAEGRPCISRACVQAAELLKQKLNEKEVKCEPSDEDLEIDDFELQRGKKGRKPKNAVKQESGEIRVQSRKRRQNDQVHTTNDDLGAALNKYYQNNIRRHRGNKQWDQGEKQCQGPSCWNSNRPGSLYCSSQCGMEMARRRLVQILPQRFNDLFHTEPLGQVQDCEQMEHVVEQIGIVQERLNKLESWKQKVEKLVIVLQSSHQNADEDRNEEDSMVLSCPICGGEFLMREVSKHIQSCYVRSERQATYGTDYLMPTNHYNLYCEEYNKINGTYCKRLRYACAEHYKEDNELKICGCPLNWYKGRGLTFDEMLEMTDNVMDGGGYCLEKHKSCRNHRNWTQTTFSLIDNERMNLLNKYDELSEKRQSLCQSILDRGDVHSLLCNKRQIPVQREVDK